jgi:tetratricopeptide (TPR) repeat protein
MNEADDLFSKAYELDIVDDKPDESIELCERALALDPDSYRVRVYLGMLLADHGKTTAEQKRGHDKLLKQSEGQPILALSVIRGSKNPLFITWAFGIGMTAVTLAPVCFF